MNIDKNKKIMTTHLTLSPVTLLYEKEVLLIRKSPTLKLF